MPIKGDKKDYSIRLRLQKDEKERFYAICDKKGYTPSKVLRLLIEKWVKENG